jgi:hypothetical protein
MNTITKPDLAPLGTFPNDDVRRTTRDDAVSVEEVQAVVEEESEEQKAREEASEEVGRYYTGEQDSEAETYTGERDRRELDLQKGGASGGGTRSFGTPTYSTRE